MRAATWDHADAGRLAGAITVARHFQRFGAYKHICVSVFFNPAPPAVAEPPRSGNTYFTAPPAYPGVAGYGEGSLTRRTAAHDTPPPSARELRVR